MSQNKSSKALAKSEVKNVFFDLKKIKYILELIAEYNKDNLEVQKLCIEGMASYEQACLALENVQIELEEMGNIDSVYISD